MRHPTFSTLLDDAERKFGDRIFVRQGATELSYRELASRSRSVAAALSSLPSVREGDCVAVFLENIPEFFEVLFGIALAGLRFVPINRRLNSSELSTILNDCKARVLISDDTDLADEIAENRIVINVRGNVGEYRYSDFLALPPLMEAKAGRGAIYYTTGTTGTPKGVVRSEASNVWMAFASLTMVPTTARSTWLYTLPFSSVAVYGLGFHVILVGGTLLIPPSYKADEVLGYLCTPGVTHAFMSPTLWRRVHSAGVASGKAPAELRWAIWGGMPITRTLLERLEAWLPVPCTAVYGLTEAGCAGFSNSRDYLEGRIHAAGFASPGVSYRIIDDIGTELPAGESGEICVRGNVLMDEYFGRPAETAEVYSDGWLRTGDEGYLDEAGMLYIVDRRKDLIISGGENIAPTQVETCIAEIRGVDDVAVVGIQDEDWGEAVCAAVVRSDQNLTASEIQDHVRKSLPAFMKPKQVFFLDSIPRNDQGKADRKNLRLFLEESQKSGVKV